MRDRTVEDEIRLIWSPFVWAGRSLLAISGWAGNYLASRAPDDAYASVWISPEIGRIVFWIGSQVGLYLTFLALLMMVITMVRLAAFCGARL